MDLHKILFSTRKTAIVQKLYRISKRDIGSSLRDRKPYGVVWWRMVTASCNRTYYTVLDRCMC